MARETTIIDRRPNQIPEDLEEKIQKLEPGQVVRIKLNPLKFRKVKMISGTSDNMDIPKQSGMVPRAGNIGIAAHWDLLWGGKRIPCGFFDGYDTADNPIYKPLKFNFGADMFLYGDKPEHQEIYRLLQIHPQYKNRVSGPVANAWVCELDIAEAASSTALDEFLYETKVKTRVANLNQDELNILVSPAMFGTGFLNRPDAVNNSTVARGIILTELMKSGGLKKVDGLIGKMDKAKELLVFQDFFANKKLTLVGKGLFDEKGGEIHTFSDSFKGNNAEEQALFLYDKGKDIPAVKEAIEAIKAYKKK